MQCSWNVWPQLPPKVWENAYVITVFYEIYGLFDNAVKLVM